MGKELVIDTRLRSCPGPLVILMQEIRNAKPGLKVKLLTTDPKAIADIRKWVTINGHKFLEFKQVDDYFEVYLEI